MAHLSLSVSLLVCLSVCLSSSLPFDHLSFLRCLQCWSVDSYHLWLLPRGRSQLGPSLSAEAREKEKSLGAHLVVLTFLKSAFVSNPIIVSKMAMEQGLVSILL